MALGACNDESSPIGSGLVADDVAITVDSLVISVDAHTSPAPKYDARSSNNIIGRISTPEYGDLECSYVARLMCASTLPVADSITANHIDSVKILMRVPRGMLTGDSLAPQQIRIYRMDSRFNAVKADTITNEFNPEGFYNPADLIASKSYTLSSVGLSDVQLTSNYLTLPVSLEGKAFRDFGPDLFEAYRKEPDTFQWPQKFATMMPGIYVKPVFGSGCVANIAATQFMIFYHTRKSVTEYIDGEIVTHEKIYRDSVSLLSTAPEVLSTNRIDYKPSALLSSMASAGKCIVTAPGGFQTHITFPAEKILEEYLKNDGAASMISNLTFAIPASPIQNDYGIGAPPYLLMIKTSDVTKFFNEGSVPDGKNSFWAAYDPNQGRYAFTSMRDYIISLTKKEEITEDDTDFMLIPVNLNMETSTSSYTGQSVTAVTACTPFLSAPAMCELYTDRTIVVFTYSAQFSNN